MAGGTVTRLGYLGIEVADLAAWRTFATDILGLESASRDGDPELFLRMDDHHHRFALTPGERDDLALIGFEVPSSADLRQIGDRLEATGHPVTWGKEADRDARRVVDLFRFDDPSGIVCEAYCGPLVRRDAPFRSPRPIGSFATGALGMGHITITVDSLEDSLRFYCDLLGFRLSDWVRPQPERGVESTLNLAFLHCNPRHHSLAFWEAPDAPKRLHHFMLQMERVDDVGATYDLCQDRGVPIELTLGRHTNDEMLSFYMGSPSGFWVEVGWGAREVDQANWQVELHTTGSSWGHRRPA